MNLAEFEPASAKKKKKNNKDDVCVDRGTGNDLFLC